MINPKEKADDLISKIILSTLTSKRVAKICALIAVDEILEVENNYFPNESNYWQEVQKEIELL